MKLLLGLMCGMLLHHINNKDKKPLITAINHGSLKDVQQLIKDGVDVNESTVEKLSDTSIDYGESPLMLASKKADVAIMAELIAAGADVNFITGHDQPYWGRPVLAYAIDSGSALVVTILIEAGARVNEFVDTDVKIKPRVRIQPLLTYAINNRSSLEIMRALIAGGADVNKHDAFEGWTPLMIAAHNGQTSVVELLLEAGADVYEVNMIDHQHSARYYAKKQGHKDIVRLLDKASKKEN